MNTKIMEINDDGVISEKAIYSIGAKEALVCYLEQSINSNYETWRYFGENFKDNNNREFETKSKFLDTIKPIGVGDFSYSVPNTNTVIFTKFRPTVVMSNNMLEG